MKIVITENQKKSLIPKLQKMIDKIGFMKTSKAVGGFGNLLNILGSDLITDKIKIKIINEIILKTDEEYITLIDMDESPLILRDEDKEISQIEMLYPIDVAVFHYGGYNYSQDLGESYIQYEDLSSSVLDNIYNMVVNYGMDNDLV